MAYILIFFEKEPWKGGKGGSRFRLSHQLRGFIGSITGRILKNLRATISEGKDENFPEKLLDFGFFRLHRFSLRAS